jgi:hypothetical protein
MNSNPSLGRIKPPILPSCRLIGETIMLFARARTNVRSGGTNGSYNNNELSKQW